MSDVSYTKILADFACNARYDDLPETTRHATKRLILDTIGCAVGGFTLPSTQILEKVFGALGGAGDATVLVGGRKLPLPAVSFINAHASNALDAEDTTLWAGHFSSCAVMPPLAAAERVGASGRDLLAAVAISFDVVARMGLSMKQIRVDADGKPQLGSVRGHGWTAFAATAGVGRLYRLGPTEMLDAFGITGSTAPLPSTGHWSYLPPPRPMTKYTLYGACAETGVKAVLLAREGFTSDRAILDGERGLWVMYGSPAVEFEAIPDRLGERWLIEETSFKYYPSCRFSHPAIDMVYDLKAEHDLKADEIERIEIRVPPHAFNLRMENPAVANAVDGEFSIPYMVGLALAGVEPGPRWHTDETRARKDVARIAGLVAITPHPEAAAVVMTQLKETGRAYHYPYSLMLKARGKSFDKAASSAKGDPWGAEPFSDATLKKKLNAYCEDLLSASQIDAVYNIVMEIEREPKLDRLLANLVSVRSRPARTAAE